MRNLSKSSVAKRIILEEGTFKALLKIWLNQKKQENLAELTFLFSFLCKGHPYPDIQKITLAIPFFLDIFQSNNDPRIVAFAIRGLYYLLRANSKMVHPLLESCDYFGKIIIDKIK